MRPDRQRGEGVPKIIYADANLFSLFSNVMKACCSELRGEKKSN